MECFDRPLAKGYVFPFNKVPKDSKLLIYGAGNVGKAYVDQIKSTEYSKDVQWVDSNYLDYDGTEYDGEVKAPDSVNYTYIDYAVIAIANPNTAKEIRAYLINKGVEARHIVWRDSVCEPVKFSEYKKRVIRPARSLIYDMLSRKGKEYLDKEIVDIVEKNKGVIIPRLVVIITTKCTLKCRHCCNLIPHYGKGSYNLPLNELVEDIKRIMAAVDYCVSLELIGGEPFLYPDLAKLLEEVLSLDKILEIELTTNATFIPSTNVLQLLKHPKIYVRISEYPNLEKQSTVIGALKKNGIHCSVARDMVWKDWGEPVNHGRTYDQLKLIYNQCSVSLTCKTLLNGKIYACARAAHLHDLKYCIDNEYVDVRSSERLGDDIKEFFLRNISHSCNYCTLVDSPRELPVAEQV